MHRLILMRHAKSDWSFGLPDHERPLNKRGETSAVLLGGWMRSNGYIPDQILSSSSTRTGQTLLGLKLDENTPTQFLQGLYHAEALDMLGVLQTASGKCVLMLGHNPGICEFAHRLVDDPPHHIRFEDYPTAATTVIDFDVSDWSKLGWHQGEVVDFVIPRELK